MVKECSICVSICNLPRQIVFYDCVLCTWYILLRGKTLILRLRRTYLRLVDIRNLLTGLTTVPASGTRQGLLHSA